MWPQRRLIELLQIEHPPDTRSNGWLRHRGTGRFRRTVGAEISSHPDVAKLSFTGSTAVGKTILRAAADTLERVTLELGGKSPVVVLDDANFESVVPLAIQAGFMNSGQACIAGTRILVPQNRLAEFEARVREEVARTQAGDPRDPQTSIGPMVSQKQWERVQRCIRIGTDGGARLIAGGEGRPDGIGAGWFLRPTVFSDVTNDMTIAREEIFGPVLSIITYHGTEDAISIANDTVRRLQAIGYRSRVRHVWAGGFSRAAGCSCSEVTQPGSPVYPLGDVPCRKILNRDVARYALAALAGVHPQDYNLPCLTNQ